MLPLPMQDSLPAGWLAFTGWELNPLGRNERFPRCYIFFPFPGFILTLREFIALLSGGAAALAPAARGQQSENSLRIGFIAHRHEQFYEPLFERLRELGYEEGRNLIVERRYAGGHADRFQGFAEEMVRLNVDIIIVITTPAAQAAKKATKTIPIVHPA